MTKTKKLGLVGTLLANAAMFFGGCASAPKPSLTEELAAKLTKRNEEYCLKLEEANKTASKEFNAALKANKEKQYENANNDIQKTIKKVEEMEAEAKKQRELIMPSLGKDYSPKTDPDSSSNGYSIDVYGFQRNQIKGKDKPKWTRGIGSKFNLPIAKGLGAHANFERDEKYREVSVPGVGSLDLTSTGTNIGTGLGYKLINSDALEVSLCAGIFKRIEENRINGVVGINPIREKDKFSYLGADAGIEAKLNLGKNIGINLGAHYENHNLENRKNNNAKSGIKYLLGGYVKF